MDTGFFASKYFVISAVVATAILGAAAASYAVGFGPGGSWDARSACDAPGLVGAPIAVERHVSIEDGGRRRVETYTLDASSYDAGSAQLCATVGDLAIETAPGAQATLVFTIHGDTAEAVGATRVDASFAADGSQLRLAGWQSVAARSRGFFGDDTAGVTVALRLPANGAWEITASTDVGNVRAEGLLAAALDIETAVGAIRASAIDLQGNASLAVDVGDVALSLTSVQTGRIVARSDVGDVEISLPQRADVGYDARAEAGVGDVTLRLGTTEQHESDGDGPGESESARTAGYAEKPTQVTVQGTTDVGDVSITVG